MICISHFHTVLIALGDPSFGKRQLYDRPLPYGHFPKSYILQLPSFVSSFPYVIVEERYVCTIKCARHLVLPKLILMFAHIPIFQLLAVATHFNHFETWNKEGNLRKSIDIKRINQEK